MKRIVSLAVTLWTSCLFAQQPVYQTDHSVKLKVDGLFREEWTRDIAQGSPTTFVNQDRWRARLVPRVEMTLGKLDLGVGGDFNYSSDKNVDPEPPLIRDNYNSRSARLDLAYADFKPTSWLGLEAGRFPMPVGLTGMIWDRNLRPQGGALSLQIRDRGSLQRLGLTVLGAEGSHVFDDRHTKMLLVSADTDFLTGPQAHFVLAGSYVKFFDVDRLEPKIRRQNTRVPNVPAPAPLAFQYEVVDGVARFRWDGSVPIQLVADYCWNRAVSDSNRGLWLAVVLGSGETPGRFEYIYADIDKDATVGAYGADDYFWTTGWEGHRGDLGIRATDHASIHAIAQIQRFKDGPVELQDHWVKRFRAELRLSY